MDEYELSPDEQETLETYECEVIVNVNGQANWNEEYAVSDFHYFRHLLPSGRVLDLGCGTAPHARFFSRSPYGYVGIDASRAMLREAKSMYPDEQFFRMRMQTLFFHDNSFDGFWSFAALPHIPRDTIDLVLREITRVTRRGGIGCVELVEGNNARMVEAEGKRALVTGYQPEEFAEIARRNSLRVVEQGGQREWGELIFFLEVVKE